MDEIQKRLKETSEACIAAYEKWAENKKSGETSEKLQDAIHELRKVASRLEIELAISERDENAAKPLPIPPHRAAQRGGNGDSESDGDGDGDAGRHQQHHHQQQRQGRGGGRNRPHRKSAGGGRGNGNS